jgi:AcrR family transcriptional regulator
MNDKAVYGVQETLQKDEAVIREIIDTSRGLFKKYGFKKTTMGDIALGLGRAKSSLYYYYTGKEEIFEAVVNAEMEELLALIRESVGNAQTAREKLVAYCQCKLDKLTQLYNLSDVLKSEIAELHCMLSAIKSKFDTAQVDLVGQILTKGMENGEFRKISPDNTQLFSYLIVSAFRGLEMPLMVSDQNCPRLDIQIGSFVDLMVEGIGISKSR